MIVHTVQCAPNAYDGTVLQLLTVSSNSPQPTDQTLATRRRKICGDRNRRVHGVPYPSYVSIRGTNIE